MHGRDDGVAAPPRERPGASSTALAGRALVLLGGGGEEPGKRCELVWVGEEEDAIARS